MKKFAVADIGVALYLLCAFIFLIVPIPSFLLDIALAANISIAFAVLFNTMFAKEVLDYVSGRSGRKYQSCRRYVKRDPEYGREEQ